MKRFGEKLRVLREQHGLTLQELGDRLGVHNTYVSKLEQGKRTPNVAMVLKVADTFNVTADRLIRDELDLD